MIQASSDFLVGEPHGKPEQPRAMVVLNVLGEELRWADGVNCETSNGILQPKVGYVGVGGGYSM